MLFPGGRRKALSLSYDDGTIHDRTMVSILNRYGIRATFHLNSAKLGQEGCVSAAEVRSLYSGHEIASHTMNHPNLCEFDESMIR
ncbi:polysaccharide deacetylase, partial [bacterium]|nr:polysaccharide deacetylase [bacterium]